MFLINSYFFNSRNLSSDLTFYRENIFKAYQPHPTHLSEYRFYAIILRFVKNIPVKVICIRIVFLSFCISITIWNDEGRQGDPVRQVSNFCYRPDLTANFVKAKSSLTDTGYSF